MGNMKFIKKPRIVLVPYPAQGHVTPMLKLASAILNHGFQPVMAIPEFIHRQIEKRVEVVQEEISCVSIPDGLDEEAPRDFFAIEAAMENYMPLHLERLVRELNEEDGIGVVCIVFDLLASWAIKVADQCGVPAAGFWPAMLATYHLIAAGPELVSKGLISETGILKQEGTLCSIPGQPVMIKSEELPWLIGTLAQRKSRFKFWTTMLDRTRTLRWLLVNSFPQEHDFDKQQMQLVDHESTKEYHYPLVNVVPVGPLSKHTIAKNKNPVSFWDEDMSCLDWLDKQDPSSVVYISFGSLVSSIGEEKIKDIALGLEASGHPFIWVLRTAWREGLPMGYVERLSSKQGKVVSWAPQMEVLQHKAVGCYLTHCGWNSTMEAIQCKKRLLCYPVAGDQFVNCAYIVKVWKIGVRLIKDFGREDVEEGLRRVMDDSEMDKRLMRLYEKTMGEEACSSVVGNLTAFIDNLNKLTSGSSIKVLNGF